jgi:glycerol kinase
MQADSGVPLKRLKVDGGAAVNDALMQFQADLLDVPLIRPAVTETTALGAALLAGLGVSLWPSVDALTAEVFHGGERDQRVFAPGMTTERRDELYRGWKDAVRRTLTARE